MVATEGETGRGQDKQKVSVTYGKSVMSAQIVGGVSIIRSRNGAASRKGCVVNGQITKERSNRRTFFSRFCSFFIQ